MLAVVGTYRAFTGPDDAAPSGPGVADPDPSDAAPTTDPGSGQSTAPPTDADPTTAAADCSGEVQTVQVLAAPAVAAAIEQAEQADATAADPCVRVAVSRQPSFAVLAGLLTSEGGGADLWIPDSTVWPALVAARGVPVEQGPVLATSPVVLAGTEAVFTGAVDKAGLSDAPTWPELLAARLPLRVSDPSQDAATLSFLMAADTALGDSEAAAAQRETLLVDLAQAATSGDPMELLTDDQPVLVPTTQQAVDDAVRSGEPLRALEPEGGAGVLAYSLVTLPGADAPADALAAVEQRLTGEQGAAAFAAAGLQPGGADLGPVDALAVAALADQWQRIQPPSRMLAVIDVSGSMDENAGDSTRIAITSQAAVQGLDLLPERTAVGLWIFSTDRGKDGQDYLPVIPVRPLEADVDGTTQKELLARAARGMDEDLTTGDTGLHDTILAAYRSIQSTYQEGYVNSVVLLTDGVNDDTTGGLSEAQLIRRLEAEADPQRPVRVILVGMGPDVDADALERIAVATGGRSYVAEDPSEIGQVFVQAIADRP